MVLGVLTRVKYISYHINGIQIEIFHVYNSRSTYMDYLQSLKYVSNRYN